ncbi:MAG: rhodanese-like domain-containing protein [Rhizomicrobium sp.]|jgi:rhodanese-related sulfurtransferase
MNDGTQKNNYAGDISAQRAWDILSADPLAQLVDVRTAAEWNYVGVPDLTGTGRDLRTVEYQSFPSGTVNPSFVANTARELEQAGAGRDAPVMFICRSGARSRAAAILMTESGWTQAYNVAGGFEGELNEQRHRGTRNGWKASGLPWRQS